MLNILKIRPSQAKSKYPRNSNIYQLVNGYDLTIHSGAVTNNYLHNFTTTNSITDLQQKIAESKETIITIIKNAFQQTKRKGVFIYFNLNETINKILLEQLKKERFFQRAIYENSKIFIQDENIIPYINTRCNKSPLKQLLYLKNDPLLISPSEQIKYITGENTHSDKEKIIALEKTYTKLPIAKLIEIKTKLAKEIYSLTQNENLIPDYKYSKDEIKHLKILNIKYNAIKNILNKYNISTDCIEMLFSSNSLPNINLGDRLPNKDILIGFTKIYDKKNKENVNAISTFSNTDIGYRFKIYHYNKELISSIEKYKKQFMYFLKNKNFKNINSLNNKFADYIENTEIAEVYVEKLDRILLQKKLHEDDDISNETINKVLSESTESVLYYIKNLRNFDPNRYFNTASPLISCLKNFAHINNIKEAYTEAIAFNNVKHSPIGLYLRAGFIPISLSKDEIYNAIYSPEGFDYTKNVWMKIKM